MSFIEHILVVTKGSKEQHLEKVENAMKNLDEAGIRLEEEKRKIPQTETEWLGFKTDGEWSEDNRQQNSSYFRRAKAQNSDESTIHMGAINQMNQFIPNLAKLCAPFDRCCVMIQNGNGKTNMIEPSKKKRVLYKGLQ